jgi:hypothetical protein
MEMQDHMRLIEENGVDSRYLNVTYKELLEESNDDSEDVDDAHEHVPSELQYAGALDPEETRHHRKRSTGGKDSRRLESASKSKDLPKALDNRGESGRKTEEKHYQAVKEQRMYAEMFTAPFATFRKLSSAASVQETEAVARKKSAGSTPPVMSPRLSRSRDLKGKRAKARERRTPKADARNQVSPEAVDVFTDEPIQTPELADWDGPTLPDECGHSSWAPAIFQPQRQDFQDCKFRPTESILVSNANHDVIILDGRPTRIDSCKDLREFWTPLEGSGEYFCFNEIGVTERW